MQPAACIYLHTWRVIDRMSMLAATKEVHSWELTAREAHQQRAACRHIRRRAGVSSSSLLSLQHASQNKEFAL
jgi:hypothetical protein